MRNVVQAGQPPTAAVQAARERLLAELSERTEELALRAVAAMTDEIPAYAAQDERHREDVFDHLVLHYRLKIDLFLADQPVDREQLAFSRGPAMRRARAGIALEDYVNAFRVSQQVFWDAILEIAGDSDTGRDAAMSLVRPLMHYVDAASTTAGRAYVEFQQYVVADADRERRDLLECLLEGEMPTRGPLLAAARRYGLEASTRMLVAAAVPTSMDFDNDAPYSASAALARAGLAGGETLVVVRQAEIVVLLAVGAHLEPRRVCDKLDAVQERLRRESLPLAIGVGTVAEGVAEVPRAYQEARLALECVAGDGGVAALPRMSPFRYLALRADDTSRRLVDPAVRTFLEEDRARGGPLCATIRAFADADLNLRLAAERLHVHHNTAQYRMSRVEERTGRNPRRIDDLIDLLVAIELEDPQPPRL